jgi:hypothetical protein
MKVSQRIPYYVVKKGQYGYWQPTAAMRAAGFAPVKCGKDGPDAWQVAIDCNLRWQKHRASKCEPTTDRHRSALGYVYFAIVGDSVKIGFSKRPLARVGQLATGMSTVPRMIVAIRGRQEHEARIHDIVKRHCIRGEWFKANSVVLRFMARCTAFDTLDEALDGTIEERKVGTVPTVMFSEAMPPS